MFNKTNNSIDFIKFLINYRIQLTDNKKLIEELNKLLKNPNITDEYIKEEISKTGLSRHDLNEKINEKLYSDFDKQKAIESVIKVCQKENKNNERKNKSTQTTKFHKKYRTKPHKQINTKRKETKHNTRQLQSTSCKNRRKSLQNIKHRINISTTVFSRFKSYRRCMEINQKRDI